MSQRKFLILGITGILVALLAGCAALILVLTSRPSRDRIEQKNGDLTLHAQSSRLNKVH